MLTFPSLSTGAIAQHPLGLTTAQESGVIRFLDGSDQRYQMRGRGLRRWRIQLALLNESESQILEAFYVSQLGEFSPFAFPDPISGTLVPNCRFGAGAYQSAYLGIDNGSAELWVVETNG